VISEIIHQRISLQIICDAPMEKYTGRECERYSGGFETRTASMSKGIVKIFHKEMIRGRAAAVLDRLAEKLQIGTTGA